MISVVIPTYRRPHDLARCLRGLQKQTHKPGEIIVVVRESDSETLDVLTSDEWADLNLHIVPVTVSGQVAALNKGLDAATGDYIAITDDDTVPRPDWLERIVQHFLRDPLVGGVGGRDWVHEGDGMISACKDVVGKLHWFGRVVGNHHLGHGPAREVDILKGANMSYRRSAIRHIRFDEQLKGQGAQVCNDMAFSLAVKHAGWKLIYDPLVAVDHYPAVRHDEDQRNRFNPVAVYNSAYNETVTLARYMGTARKAVFLLWAALIGTSGSPGLLQWIRLLAKWSDHATAKYLTVQKGRFHAFADIMRWGKRNPGSSNMPVGGDQP